MIVISTKRILTVLAAMAVMLLLMGAGRDSTGEQPEAVAASDSAAALDLLQAEQEAEADAEPEPEPEPEPTFLYVDGVGVEVNYTLYHGSAYVSVVDFATALDPEAKITWTGSGVVLSTEKLTLTVEMNSSYAVANGRYLYLKYGAIIHEGSAMLPATVLAKAFDAQLKWNAEDATIHITTGSGALVSGDSFYPVDDLYWLSRIINAESCNQPLQGKIAVGNVVLNRVESSSFPNTVYGVVFQKNQFSPVSNGAINRQPSEQSVIAAKLVLDGASAADNVLYFNRAGVSCWASRYKTYVTTIGDHAFFK